MTDDNDNVIGLGNKKHGSDEDPQRPIEDQEEIQSVHQLKHFRNLKLTLNKMVGEQWLLLYRDPNGTPIFVPNENLDAEDQIFLAELAKHVIFQMISLRGQDE